MAQKSLLTLSKMWVVTVGFLMSSALVMSLAGILYMSDHWSSCQWRNTEPFHHKSHAASFSPFVPLEGILARFRLPGQWHHSLLSDKRCIPDTQCSMYWFQGLWLFNVTVESVQYRVGTGSGSEAMMVAISWLKVTTPSNSKHGILCFFTGATPVFDAINAVLTQLLSYTDCNYSSKGSHALQNWWSCLVHGLPMKEHLGTWTLFK